MLSNGLVVIDNPPLVIIAGATGSGKSSVALKIAKSIDGEILNVDSVQLYRGFDIGSGKILPREREGVPHHLIDIRNGDNPINVSEFIDLADTAIKEIRSRNKRVIVVAGTTLYLKCLIHGIAQIPGKNVNLRLELEKLDTAELIRILQIKDPTSLKTISTSDRVRLIRAIEVEALTGKPFSALIEEHSHREVRYSAIALHLCWPREKLYERIDKRCEEMIRSGLIDETFSLKQKYGEAIFPLKSLGYAQALKFDSKDYDSDMVLSEIKIKTRQFAKRQLTFWRNQPLDLGWVVLPDNGEGIMLTSRVKPVRKGAVLNDFRVMELSLTQLIERLRAFDSSAMSRVQLWNISASQLLEGSNI